MDEKSGIKQIIREIFDNVRDYNDKDQIQVNCPRCQEESGLIYPDGKFNLEINVKKRVFKCWKCSNPKFKGNLGKLINIYGNKNHVDKYRSLTLYSEKDYFSFEEEEKDENNYIILPKEFIPFSELNQNDKKHMEAYSYMVVDRKINYDKLIDYNIGFCLDGKYKDRIIFPSYNKFNELNFFVSRLFRNKKFKWETNYLNPLKINYKNLIFCENKINWDSTVYILEGVFDMLSIYNSTPQLGKKISYELFRVLKQKKPNVVIVFDPDAHNDSMDIYQMIYDAYYGCEEKLKIVILNGENDIDEIRRNYGNEKVIENLYKATVNLPDYFSFNI